MNKFERYYQIELQLKALTEEKNNLRSEIEDDVKAKKATIETPFGHFIKVTRQVWDYSKTHIQWRERKLKQIDAIKKEIKERELRIRVLNRAESDKIVGFRYNIKKATV